MSDRDELFNDAVLHTLDAQCASVSLLQRKLGIGYARASRLIEQIAEAGIVGEYRGTGGRDVNYTLEEWAAQQP